ncbi:MAG: helix-turn-helix domain-containing protein [Fimbriimonas sp.]
MTVEIPFIETDTDLESVVERITELWGAERGTREYAELKLLTLLAHAYEQEHHPITPPHPIDAVKFVMEQQGVDPKEMYEVFGDRVRYWRFMNGERELSKEQMRTLHQRYRIPYESLMGIETPKSHRSA